MAETISCVFMDKMYGVRKGDIMNTEEAYWMEDELIINSFNVDDIQYSAYRVIEMKVEREPNVRITTPISGKIVGRIIIDSFRNVTMFSLEV